jgi:cobalt-zinc-cadmium efflux system outer membrane protein
MKFSVAHAGLFCLATLGPTALAQTNVVEAPAAPPLTLAHAVAAALEGHPDLQGRPYALRAAEGRIAQAGLRPNPELSVEFENFAGSGAAQGADALEATLSLSQVIEFGDKRGRRIGVASAERESLVLEQEARQLDVLAEVARRFIAVVAAQEQLSLARQVETLAQNTLNAMDRRVQAARSPEAERSRATIARIRARLDRQRSEQTLQSARLQLAALWGAGDWQVGEAQADLYAIPTMEPFAALTNRIQRNPDLLRLATEGRLREAELRLAQAQGRPNLQVGAGVRRLEESGDAAFVAALSIPLPMFDRNQGAIAEAQARSELTAAQRKAAEARARSTLNALHQEFVVARQEAEALREEVIPQAERALAQTESVFTRGRYSYLELVNAQRELMDARRAAIDAAADAHRLVAELERLTAEPLTAAKP